MTVYKYPIVLGPFILELPQGAAILHVDVQDDAPYFWACVDPEAAKESRAFVVVGTGHEAPAASSSRHVGTFMLHEGQFVGHLFELS